MFSQQDYLLSCILLILLTNMFFLHFAPVLTLLRRSSGVMRLSFRGFLRLFTLIMGGGAMGQSVCTLAASTSGEGR